VGKYGTTRQATDGSIVRCMHIACCIRKTIVTYPEYVILIAFPWQQCYREHVSLLHLYVHCLSCHSPVYTCARTHVRARAHTHTHTHTHNVVRATLNLSAVGCMGWWWTYDMGHGGEVRCPCRPAVHDFL
jgi:hypothetical protein